MSDLATISAKLADARARRAAAKAGQRGAAARYAAAADETAAAEEAQQIIQAAAQAVQQQAHNSIAAVVGRCLTAVFDEPYAFDIQFEQRRGRTEAVLAFVRGGQSVDPLTAAGGGPVDVAAFALRCAALALARPQARRLLVLDEPFRFMNPAILPRVAALLQSLAAEMDMQIIMVTHAEELATGANIVQL